MLSNFKVRKPVCFRFANIIVYALCSFKFVGDCQGKFESMILSQQLVFLPFFLTENGIVMAWQEYFDFP